MFYYFYYLKLTARKSRESQGYLLMHEVIYRTPYTKVNEMEFYVGRRSWDLFSIYIVWEYNFRDFTGVPIKFY